MQKTRVFPGWSLMLCHGRKHGLERFEFIDKDTAITVDNDLQTNPDVLLDITNLDLAKPCELFDNVVLAYCPTFLFQAGVLPYDQEPFLDHWILQFSHLLKPLGRLIMPEYKWIQNDKDNAVRAFKQYHLNLTTKEIVSRGTKWLVFVKSK
jgi:hypothetical protein